MENNSGLAACRLRDGDNEDFCSETFGWRINDMLVLERAPIVSCTVGRSFSQYKALLRQNRESMLFENLGAFIVDACNQF